MEMTEETKGRELIRPQEAANIRGVTTRTLINWARDRRLTTVMTAGGHRRYYLDEVTPPAPERG